VLFRNIVIGLICWLLTQNAFSFELDGFKNIKFGMTRMQLESQGMKLDCHPDFPRCYLTPNKGFMTLLGKEVGYIQIILDAYDEHWNGKVISVSVGNRGLPKKTTDDLTIALGDSGEVYKSVYESTDVLAKDTVEISHVWFSSSKKQAVLVRYFRDADYEFTTVEFQGPEMMAKTLNELEQIRLRNEAITRRSKETTDYSDL